ncbi:MAG: hypothetical protein ABW104_10450 [Candidatus Thiodiazotropha sp. 6PLUC2]
MKIIGLLLFIGYLYTTPSLAAELHIDPLTNNLTGISGITVDENIYNVSFVEGTCVELFGGCDERTDFFFQDTATAFAAFSGLMEQGLLDGPSGQFDSNPQLTYGCNNDQFFSRQCVIQAPILANEQGLVGLVFASATNHISNNNDITTGLLLSASLSINADTALNDSAVWGVWSATTVPVPAAVWLFGSGLIGLLSIRKSANDKTG